MYPHSHISALYWQQNIKGDVKSVMKTNALLTFRAATFLKYSLVLYGRQLVDVKFGPFLSLYVLFLLCPEPVSRTNFTASLKMVLVISCLELFHLEIPTKYLFSQSFQQSR